jgi:hypothetical protein
MIRDHSPTTTTPLNERKSSHVTGVMCNKGEHSGARRGANDIPPCRCSADGSGRNAPHLEQHVLRRLPLSPQRDNVARAGARTARVNDANMSPNSARG